MLIKLLNDEAIKTKKAFTKKSKQEIDESHNDYHDSSYWDHMYTKFFEVSVAQNHAQAVKEWELIGYKYNPQGQNCFFHENITYHLYLLRNKLNGNEIEVGEDCAASHALPAGIKKYSSLSYEKMRELCKTQKKLMINAKSRKFLETHGFLIEDALDMLNKYRPLLRESDNLKQFDKNLAALTKLHKDYYGSRRAAAGERTQLIYWHDAQMKKLTELLNILYKKAPLLKKYPGFERKMRALYNFRELFTTDEKHYIEQQHSRWNKDLSADSAGFPFTALDSGVLMKFYDKLLTNSNLLEIDLLSDGRFRLTLRLFENHYKTLLSSENAELFALIKDALLFLTQKGPAEFEQLRGKIEVLTPRRGPEEPKFTLLAPLKKFIQQINDEWPATGVITREQKERIEATLADLRDPESRLTQEDVLRKDKDFAEKIEFLRKYQSLFIRETRAQIDDLYRTWSANRFYRQSIEQVDALYKKLRMQKYKYAQLLAKEIPDVDRLIELAEVSKYLRVVKALNKADPAEALPSYLAEHKYTFNWDERIERLIYLYELENALRLINSADFQNDYKYFKEYFVLKSDLSVLDLKKIEILTSYQSVLSSYNSLKFNSEHQESCALLGKKVSSLWNRFGALTRKQLDEIRDFFYESSDLTFDNLTLAELPAKTNDQELSRRLADFVRIYNEYGVLPKDWTIELYRYLTDQSYRHLVILKKRIGVGELIQRQEDRYLEEVKAYLKNNAAQTEYYQAVLSFISPFQVVLDSYNIKKIYELLELIEDREQRREALSLLINNFEEKLKNNKKDDILRTIRFAISRFKSLRDE